VRFSRRNFVVGFAAGAACRSPEEGTAPSQKPPAKPDAATLRIITYNVLAEAVGVEKRVPVLLDLLEQSDADLIVLQEVAPWFLDALHDRQWTSSLHATSFDGRRVAPGGQYILSRYPIMEARTRQLSGPQRRILVVARIEVGGETIDVASTHMESFLEDGPIRAAQLDETFEELRGVHTAIFAGDFNFGDGEQPDTDHLDSSYVDVWTTVHPGDPGFTWNIEKSAMARAGSFPGEPSRRLDRVLVRSKKWRPASAQVVGDKPVEVGRPELFPSDHFGLIAQLVAD
jgi:endonuclease/exonuclease/phosphatase family metal-dependent hydrolase